MLGLYVSDLAARVEHIVARTRLPSVARLISSAGGGPCTSAGPATRGGPPRTGDVTVGRDSCAGRAAEGHPAGKPWATATLEDLEGALEVLFFRRLPAVLAAAGEDAIVIVKGRLTGGTRRQADRAGG